MSTPDFLAHPSFGIGRLTPGQKAHLMLLTRQMRPSLAAVLPRHSLVMGRYLPDGDDTPPLTPAMRRAA